MMSVLPLTAVVKDLCVSCDSLLQTEDITSQCTKNISSLLKIQSDNSLDYVECISKVLIEEYGNKEPQI